jgi:hypothetical protein
MNRDDEYRARAEEAQKEADRSISELERTRWLRIAQDWLALIRKRPKSEDDSRTE